MRKRYSFVLITYSHLILIWCINTRGVLARLVGYNTELAIFLLLRTAYCVLKISSFTTVYTKRRYFQFSTQYALHDQLYRISPDSGPPPQPRAGGSSAVVDRAQYIPSIRSNSSVARWVNIRTTTHVHSRTGGPIPAPVYCVQSLTHPTPPAGTHGCFTVVLHVGDSDCVGGVLLQLARSCSGADLRQPAWQPGIPRQARGPI